jgi:PAS domain S-box-containing protein
MNNLRLIFFAILSGIVYWFADAVFAHFYLSPDISFWNSLFHDAQSNYFYYRPTVIVMIGIAALYSSLMKKKVKERDNNIQKLMHNVKDAIFINTSFMGCGGKDKIFAVNEEAGKMLCYTEKEMLQLPIRAIIDPEKLDDLSHLMETFKTEGHVQFKTVLLKKNGSKKLVEINAQAFQYKGKPACLAVARDITKPLGAEQDFRESRYQSRLLAEQLIHVQEEERGRLSKELHDDLGQNLMFLKMQVSSLQNRLPKTLVHLRQECGKLLSQLNETTENVRRLSQDLNPRVLEEMGMTLAVDSLVRESCELYGIKSLAIDLDKIDNLLSKAAQLNIYRIIQESLTNIVKHAQATEISVKIKKQDSQLFIWIKDNGKGCEPLQTFPQRKGLGISSIHERARLIGGYLTIRSCIGGGTEMSLTIPLRRMARAGRRKGGNGSVSNSISR